MTNLGGSSPIRPASAPPRKRFALTGRSAALSPSEAAVRGDLADFDLADRVFAPHYAKSVTHRLVEPSHVRAGTDGDAEIRASLKPGDRFHLLDESGGWAWGHGDAAGSVGYLPMAALERA